MIASTTSAQRPSMSQRMALEEIENPIVRRGLELWNEARGVRRFPSRSDLTPRRLSDILRNVVLVRAVDNGEDFQVRVAGDAIVLAQGASFQGMTMQEIDRVVPGFGSDLCMLYRRVYKTREPLALRGWYERSDRNAFFHESVLLPLGSGEIVDHVLCTAVYARQYKPSP